MYYLLFIFFLIKNTVPFRRELYRTPKYGIHFVIHLPKPILVPATKKGNNARGTIHQDTIEVRFPVILIVFYQLVVSFSFISNQCIYILIS